MKYVNRVVGRDGVPRLYFRKRGHPADGAPLRSPLPQVEAGSDLEREVHQLVGIETVKPRVSNLAGATRAYELGADFRTLADSTKREYRLMLKEFDADLGALPIDAFTPAYLLQLRDLWSQRGYRAANIRLQLLKNVLNPILVGLDAADPFSRISGVRRPRDAAEPHVIWPERVVTAAIEAAIAAGRPGLARAIALGRYTGARRGDIVRIGNASRSAGRIAWLSGKRRVLVDQPEDPALTGWLERTPAAQPLSKWQAHAQRKTGVFRLPPKTLVFNISNQPYTEDGLGQELAKLVGRLHASGAIDSAEYDLHGLRHTFGVETALAGCTDAQGAVLMGHGSPHSFAQYRRQADRLRMADDGAALIAAFRERQANAGAHVAMMASVTRLPLR